MMLCPEMYIIVKRESDSRSGMAVCPLSDRHERQSCPTLCDPMDCSLSRSSIMEFYRQKYWSG